jgi:hypothetical protein
MRVEILEIMRPFFKTSLADGIHMRSELKREAFVR